LFTVKRVHLEKEYTMSCAASGKAGKKTPPKQVYLMPALILFTDWEVKM